MPRKGDYRFFLSKKNIKDYLGGKSVNDICKKEEVAHKTITRALHRAGIKTKPRGRYLSNNPSSCYTKTLARKTLKRFGYKLKKGEVIHHIDKNPLNNNIANLLIFKNGSQHIRWHRWDKDRHPNDDGWSRLARAVGIKMFMGVKI
jgi:hypothetical protein